MRVTMIFPNRAIRETMLMANSDEEALQQLNHLVTGGYLSGFLMLLNQSKQKEAV